MSLKAGMYNTQYLRTSYGKQLNKQHYDVSIIPVWQAELH
jgi:hypothetical protein